MAIIQSLKALNRRRLERRHQARQMPQPRVQLKSTNGSTMTLASKEVHLSGRSSRVFHYRPDSTGDLGVMRQIFESKDYDLHHWPQGQKIIDLFELLRLHGKTGLILDLGANIGASAVFFAERYEGVRIICVEPDPSNCDILELNLRNTDHALFRGAIASVSGSITLIDPGHGDWGFRTQALTPGQAVKAEVPADTVDNLLALWGKKCVPIVAKIDIEGAEADLFQGACDWIDLFPCIIIELHDWMLPGQGTSRNFLRQVASRDLDFVHRGENIFVFNTSLIHTLTDQCVSIS